MDQSCSTKNPITDFDFERLEQMDPAFRNQFEEIYKCKLSCQVVFQGKSNLTLQPFIIRVFV